MPTVSTRIRVSGDGSITGKAPPGVPAGEHLATIAVGESKAGPPLDQTAIRQRVLLLQERIARLPVLDARSDDEILGYDQHGTFG
jgi:hypothetical protein